MKRSHGVNVQNLIQKIEKPPQRRALQSDLQQHRQFNPFSKETQDVIKAVGKSNCVNYSMWNPKHLCKVCLSCWDVASSNCTCGHFLQDGTEENKKYIKYTLDLFSIPNYYIKEEGDPTGTATGRSKGITSTSSRIRSRRMQEERFLGYSRQVHP